MPEKNKQVIYHVVFQFVDFKHIEKFFFPSKVIWSIRLLLRVLVLNMYKTSFFSIQLGINHI